MIDSREIVAILSMFNIEKFDTVHPIQAYSSKAAILKIYLENPEYYRKFVNVAPDIFDLYDIIECEFASAFNEGGGRYGRKAYSGYKNNKVVGKSKFFGRDLYYKIPDGIIYPTLAAFRCLLIENKETFILEVMQTGCSHCTDIKPKLEKVTKDYNIEIKYINLTKMSKEDKEELGINGTPTILFYNNGVEETVASRISGDRPIDYIVSKFKANGFIKEEQ